MTKLKKGRLVLNGTTLYVIAWVMAQFNLLLKASEFQLMPAGIRLLHYFDIIMFPCVCVALAVKMFFIDRYSPKSLLLILFSMTVVYIVSSSSMGIMLILYALFLVSIKNVNLYKLIRTDMKVRILVLVSLFVLSVLGVINNFSSEINGNLKYAFGWSHPNSFAFQILIIILEGIYTHKSKLKFKDLFIVGSMMVLLWTICANRTAIYAFAVFIVLYVFAQKGYIERVKILRYMLILITPICGVVSWLLVWFYTTGSRFAETINSIITERLALAVQFLGMYPITLWGTKIETISTREAIIRGTRTQILDMSYVRLPLEYGIVFFLIFLALFFAIQIILIRRKKYREAAITAFFALMGITSNSLLTPFSNISFLFVGLIIGSRKNALHRSKRITIN